MTVGGSWWELLAIAQQARDPAYRWPSPLACPNDGEPFRLGANGVWYCPFDGYRPSPDEVNPIR